MPEPQRDLTPLAQLGLGRLRAGPVRSQRPVYVDLLPPCNAGCPAGENIQAWLALVREGDPELKSMFDAALKGSIADGTLKALFLKWFQIDWTP